MLLGDLVLVNVGRTRFCLYRLEIFTLCIYKVFHGLWAFGHHNGLMGRLVVDVVGGFEVNLFRLIFLNKKSMV